MNDRIRELAEQAWNDTREKFGSFVDDGGEIDFTFLHAYDKKFAELIVRECMSLMDAEKEYCSKPGMYESREYYERMRAKEDAFEDAASIIKSHFGVEL